MKSPYVPIAAIVSGIAILIAWIVYQSTHVTHTVVTPQVASASPPGGYAPVLFFYLNGKFAKLTQFAEVEPNLVECMEKAQIIVGKIMESDQRPPTGTVRGGCIPIPGAPALPAAAVQEPDRANHDPTPPSLGGHPSVTI